MNQSAQPVHLQAHSEINPGCAIVVLSSCGAKHGH
jgi:hypothetical protein